MSRHIPTSHFHAATDDASPRSEKNARHPHGLWRCGPVINEWDTAQSRRRRRPEFIERGVVKSRRRGDPIPPVPQDRYRLTAASARLKKGSFFWNLEGGEAPVESMDDRCSIFRSGSVACLMAAIIAETRWQMTAPPARTKSRPGHSTRRPAGQTISSGGPPESDSLASWLVW